jgi:uncharacterized protein YjbI with pentapeptide repeats
MNAFWLARFGSTAKKRALLVWKLAMVRIGRRWQWLMPRRRMVSWVAGTSIAFVLLIGFVIEGGMSWYGKHHEAIAPLLTLAAGLAVAAVALARHFGQTNADRQRRVTESFSKAVEQLASDKLEVRLGGIYSLERISKESQDDYWTVIENLTAFVRERSRRNEAERTALDLNQRASRRAYFLWLEAGRPEGRDNDLWFKAVEQEKIGEELAADIDAVLTVIKRRSELSRELEVANAWRLDLRRAVLKRAHLRDAHLEWANLGGAHLEQADLRGAHLERADLRGAHLYRASLSGAHLERADLRGAHFERPSLSGAHLDGADLSSAKGLSATQLALTDGDALTQLPEGMARPAHWPAAPSAPA